MPSVAALTLAALLTASEVVPGMHLIRGGFVPGSQPDGNTVILNAPEGLVVVDSGRHAEHTQAIVDFAKSAKKPVKAIINTHWHLDHIGGNAMLRREFPGVRVYASGAFADARKGFLANYRKQLDELLAKEPDNAVYKVDLALLDAADKLGPDEVIAEAGTKTIAGRAVLVGLEKDAATAGDVWLYDKDTGVLIAGDLITLPAPFLDTAKPKGWEAALERLAKLDFELVVPGHGAPLTRRQFAAYRNAFSSLLACKEKCEDQWLANVGPLIPNDDKEFTRAMMGYYVRLIAAPPSPR